MAGDHQNNFALPLLKLPNCQQKGGARFTFCHKSKRIQIFPSFHAC